MLPLWGVKTPAYPKTIGEQGADNVAVVLQGVLRPPATQGGTFVLEDAGFQVNIKTPRPAGQAPQ
jgi:hypothetical protein